MGSAVVLQIGYNMPLMSRLYDLHCHSLASDGTLSPTALVQRAASAGVDVLALTDHDDTGGILDTCLMQCVCFGAAAFYRVKWGTRGLCICFYQTGLHALTCDALTYRFAESAKSTQYPDAGRRALEIRQG